MNLDQTTTKINKLGGKLRPYPVNISPKDFVLKINDLENYGGDQKGLGFSQTLKNSNSNTPVIPEGLDQSWEHGNHSKELVASSQSSVPKTKSKIHCTRHKTRGLNQIKSPEGTRRIGPPFPIKSLTRFQQSMDKNNSNERNRGRRTQGRRPGETESPRTDYQKPLLT